mgnify:CR=1 FL=1
MQYVKILNYNRCEIDVKHQKTELGISSIESMGNKDAADF